MQSSYTWSKSIDNHITQIIDSASEGGVLSDPFDKTVDRGPTAFDTTHNWKFNGIYRFPELISAGGAEGALLNGWGISGILSLSSGHPFHPLLQFNRSRSGQGGSGSSLDRPDLVAGRTPKYIVSGVTAGCLGVEAGQKLGGNDLYYDPCAFSMRVSHT